jgi:hypothetical protein
MKYFLFLLPQNLAIHLFQNYYNEQCIINLICLVWLYNQLDKTIEFNISSSMVSIIVWTHEFYSIFMPYAVILSFVFYASIFYGMKQLWDCRWVKRQPRINLLYNYLLSLYRTYERTSAWRFAGSWLRRSPFC